MSIQETLKKRLDDHRDQLYGQDLGMYEVRRMSRELLRAELVRELEDARYGRGHGLSDLERVSEALMFLAVFESTVGR